MKKKVIPVLFSLFLLAGCGEPDPCKEHDYGDWTVTKEAKCGEAGTKERTCKVCNDKDEGIIDALTHEYQDAADQTGAVAATCKAAGTIVTECKNCGAKSTREVEKLTTHTFADAVDQTGAVAATCKDKGTVITQCSVCGEKSSREIDKSTEHDWGEWQEVTPATHTADGSKKRVCKVCAAEETDKIDKLAEHTFGETAQHVEADHDLIGYDIYTCATENARKIVWNANDVTLETKENKYNNEDNYKVDGEGVKFGGRPIGNAMNLPANFMNHTAVYDAKVPGAFVEYKINVKSAMVGAQLMADMQPAGGLDATAGLFLSAPEGNDWTPGLVTDGTAEGHKITDFRYVVYVNEKEVKLDASKNIAAADATARGWYNLPCTVDLKAGINNIKIVQAGGWEPTFYNFGVVSAAGIENVTPDASEGFEVALNGDSHVTAVTVYEDKACTVVDNGDKHYSRTDLGRKVNDASGQISFKVECEEGYQVKSITPVAVNGEEEPYKNIKGPSETVLDTEVADVYRITKVADDLAVAIETEPDTTEYTGYTFTFIAGEHVTIEIYGSKVYAPSYLIEGNQAVSCDETNVRPTTNDGQIYIKIIFDEGYELDKVTSSVEKAYKNIKDPKDTECENGYRFTKVAKDATITITAKAIAA